MKPSVFSFAAVTLIVASVLFFSSASFAHSDRSSNYHINTHVHALDNGLGLARNYFNYSYDQRRAKKLARNHRNNYRKHQQKRYQRFYSTRHRFTWNKSRERTHYYDGCPYTGHNH